jgi:hypothetical protein
MERPFGLSARRWFLRGAGGKDGSGKFATSEQASTLERGIAMVRQTTQEDLRDEFDALLLERGTRSEAVNRMLWRLREDVDFLRYALGVAESIEFATHDLSPPCMKSARTKSRTLEELQQELDVKLERDGFQTS